MPHMGAERRYDTHISRDALGEVWNEGFYNTDHPGGENEWSSLKSGTSLPDLPVHKPCYIIYVQGRIAWGKSPTGGKSLFISVSQLDVLHQIQCISYALIIIFSFSSYPAN